MLKKFKFSIFIVAICLLLTSCGTVKNAFDPQRKNSAEEFLVEKKSPLSMPPEFNKLPVPQNNDEDNQDQSKDIELLITENNKDNNQIEGLESSDKDFEELILYKIKND